MSAPRTFMYGHPLIEKIVLRPEYARVYTVTGNVYQVNPDCGFKLTEKDMNQIVAEAIRKERT